MHCFSGDADFARACLDRGAYLSFAGTVTFKNNGHLREALAATPLDRVLVETDAPYLTPMPLRGRPNASYLIPHTARLMAEVRGDGLEQLCMALDDNAEVAFGGPWGTLMELSEVLRRRRMVRRYYQDRPVPPTALEAIVAAALRAPSAGFTQGVSLLVLDRPRRSGHVLESDRERRVGRWLAWDADGAGPVACLDRPGGLPRPLRGARQGLDRPRPRTLVGAVLVRRRGDGQSGCPAGRRWTRVSARCFFGVPVDRVDRRAGGVRGAAGPAAASGWSASATRPPGSSSGRPVTPTSAARRTN